MVNTFLTHADFAKSAASLDRARLGKQRVEAFQILNLIQDLKLMFPLLNITKVSPKNLKSSILQVFRAVRDIPYLLVSDQDKHLFRIDKHLTFPETTIYCDATGQETCETKDILIHNTYPDPIRVPPQIKIFLNSVGDEVERETTYFSPIEHDPKPGEQDRVIRLGFANHPAVRMWFWHETALKAYINAHIDEFVDRGFNNTMKRYQVPEIYSKPKWCQNNDFHKNHRAALLKKELDRKEKAWYDNKEEFRSAGEFVAYEWPEDEMD